MVTMVAPRSDQIHDPNGSNLQESTACRLASALRSLVARDDGPPPVWRSAAFADGVEAIRTSLAKATTLSAIDRVAAVLLDGATGSGWSFSQAAQRLARDPAAVAIAMCWLEAEDRVMLPAWSEVIRRRTLEPIRKHTAPDAELWFG
jgi:hypothetical protein